MSSRKRARIYEIERQASASPQLPALESQHFRGRGADRRASEAAWSGATTSIASHLSEYENLLLQRELASRRIGFRFTPLSRTARLDAQRQQLYIERIVEPHLPDHPRYPRSLFLTAMIFAVAFAAYLMIRALSRYLQDHAEQ